jgi:hypothetical protein
METKTETAKAGLSQKDYDKSLELGKILDSDEVEPHSTKEGFVVVAREFDVDVPTTEAEAKSCAKDINEGGIVALIAEKVTTLARNAVAVSMKPTTSKLAEANAELAKAKSQTQRLVEAQNSGDTAAVAAIIAEMSA